MTFKPWSQHFNPRIEGESVAAWLQREVDMLDALAGEGKPTRAISITSLEAKALLALMPAKQAEGGET